MKISREVVGHHLRIEQDGLLLIVSLAWGVGVRRSSARRLRIFPDLAMPDLAAQVSRFGQYSGGYEGKD
jgi:hypothetical protein